MAADLYIACESSETLREAFPDAVERVELGPFEFVQLTYDALRVDEESGQGDSIGSIGEFASGRNCWLVWVDGIDEDPKPFSDIVVFTKGGDDD